MTSTRVLPHTASCALRGRVDMRAQAIVGTRLTAKLPAVVAPSRSPGPGRP